MPGLGGGDQVLDDCGRDVVAMKRRLERRLVAARLREKPVALQHAVVERRVGVSVRRESLVKRVKRGGAIGLMAIGLQQGVVLAVGQRDLLAVVQRDHGCFTSAVDSIECASCGRRREAARERQQVLALFVEHMFLLVVRPLDREAVDRQFGVRPAIQP